jgi:hypothetical protein
MSPVQDSQPTTKGTNIMDMTIKEKEQRYNVRIIATQDDTRVRGNALASGDEEEDRRYEDMILERLDAGDVWAWAQVEVQASLPDGRTGSAYLGGCCYEDEKDFKTDNPYYEDLIDQAVTRAERLEAPCIDADRKFLEDLLSFVVFVCRRTDIDARKQVSWLYSTLAHDLSGELRDDEFFLPEVNGYSDKFPLI